MPRTSPEGLDWIVQCFTSPPTQYRLYGRRFLQVKRPNQQRVQKNDSMSLRPTASKISNRTRRTAVSVVCSCQNPDCTGRASRTHKMSNNPFAGAHQAFKELRIKHRRVRNQMTRSRLISKKHLKTWYHDSWCNECLFEHCWKMTCRQ